MEEKMCPHHPDSPLKLVAVSERVAAGKVTTTVRMRCPVAGCQYTFTKSMTEEE